MIVLVTGGLRYDLFCGPESDAFDILSSLKDVAVLIHGGHLGADEDAAAWALVNDVTTVRWSRAEGQNAAMLAFALKIANPAEVLLVAFPGGHGTADMTERCRKAGIAIMAVS